MPRKDIVVIGGSAGALQVLQTILPTLPWNFPGSVFVVLHASEASPGLVPKILNRNSKLPVIYAAHNMDILPSRVYVAPAGQQHMLIERGSIRLAAGPRENRSRPSIDALFRSASYAYGGQVIGVVLSGSLDDGSAGLLAIKERGGLAIVQDPDEATAPSMPASAIETTDVDFVLPADQIGPKLVELQSTGAEKIHAIPVGSKTTTELGRTYSCPECGGVLEEVQEKGMVRFRCRVGHVYSPESLLADQTEAVEKALWAAIRSMEEQAEFSDRLADNSRHKKRPALARRFENKADVNRANAGILRNLLEKTANEVLEIPLEEGGPDYGEKTGTESRH